MIPIAAPGLTFPRCGQFSIIRYGFFMALMPGNGTGVLPRPWPFCAEGTAYTINALAIARTILALIRLEDTISVAPLFTSLQQREPDGGNSPHDALHVIPPGIAPPDELTRPGGGASPRRRWSDAQDLRLVDFQHDVELLFGEAVLP